MESSSEEIDRYCSKMLKSYNYLTAVRTAYLGSGDSPLPPTWKTYDKVFRILKTSVSLDLSMESFNLLIDLDKCYSRVCLNNSDSLGTDSSGVGELMSIKEVWSPFTFESAEASTPCCTIDSERFFDLVKKVLHGSDLSFMLVKSNLLFQYLIHVLEDDYLSRQTSYNRTLNCNFLRESIVNMLLESRKMDFRYLVHNCMSIASKGFFHEINISLEDLKGTENIPRYPFQICNIGVSFPEFRKKTCVAVHKFMILIMELDLILKESEKSGLTSNSDSFRAPILDIIVDKLVYDRDLIFPFLEVFGEPKWKLEMILLYLGKYCKKETGDVSEPHGHLLQKKMRKTEVHKIKKEYPDDYTTAKFPTLETGDVSEPHGHLLQKKMRKTEVHKIKKEYPDDCTTAKFSTLPTTDTRRINDSPNDGTLQSILNFFSNPNVSSGILREITFPVALFLVGQAFKCYFSLQSDPKNAIVLTRMIGESTLLEVCNGLISTFFCISQLDDSNQFTSFELEVLYVARSTCRRLRLAE